MLAAILGLLLAGNGLVMLGLPVLWYQWVPGVAETGPFNRHLVADVGAAFLVAGGGMIWGSLARAWPALVLGAAFLLLHAAIHLGEAVSHGTPGALLRDLRGVHLPALLAVTLAWLLRPIPEGE